MPPFKSIYVAVNFERVILVWLDVRRPSVLEPAAVEKAAREDRVRMWV